MSLALPLDVGLPMPSHSSKILEGQNSDKTCNAKSTWLMHSSVGEKDRSNVIRCSNAGVFAPWPPFSRPQLGSAAGITCYSGSWMQIRGG